MNSSGRQECRPYKSDMFVGTRYMSGDIKLDYLKRQLVRSNDSVFAPPEAKAVRLHVPPGSTLKGTLTRRETPYVTPIRQPKIDPSLCRFVNISL